MSERPNKRAACARACSVLLAGTLLATPWCRGQPAGDAATHVRDLTVQVRVIDPETNQEADHGCGLIVGADGESLHVLTARHVVEPAIGPAGTMRVSVLFAGSERWVDAVVGPSLDESARLDAAVLRVARSAAPFEGDPPTRRLAVAPIPGKETPLWAIGFDPGQGRLTWVSCVLRAVDADGAVFDGKGVVGGFSGGLLVSDVGVVGLTCESGADGLRHRALSIGGLLARIQSKGWNVSLRANPAREALENMHARGLVGALEVWGFERGTVGAVPLQGSLRVAQRGSAYGIECVTGGGRFRCELTPDADGAELRTNAKIDGVPGNRSVLPAGAIALRADPATSIPGFVILTATDEKRTIYVALAAQSSELLLARALADLPDPSGRVALSPAMRNTLFHSVDRRVNGRVAPFSLCVRETFLVDFMPPLSLHRNESFQIAGRFMVSDEMNRLAAAQAKKAARVWSGLTFILSSAAPDAAPLGSVALPWGAEELAIREVRASPGIMRVTHSASGDRRRLEGTHNCYLLLQGLRITYAE